MSAPVVLGGLECLECGRPAVTERLIVTPVGHTVTVALCADHAHELDTEPQNETED